ncbi:TadE family protein [Dermatobacter hominis]|uniref:TadE family protein n=1 Tax=Dermatobacter hominis TaxID=2884263 RepID=UPI001D10303A|nr:TadE/TadG family type IV pilus assembly protein [Dermatobacter hominis]UDY35131.1 pilus assembly protein [Dermatobacter hominis]
MGRRSHRQVHGGRRRERGAALVEFALVVPIFVLLVMGIIDFGMAFNDYNSVRQGVREGARQIVVADWGTDGCTTGSSSARAACVTRARIGLNTSDTKVKIVLPANYAPGDQVKVCAMYPFRSLTGLFSAILNGSMAKSKLSMRIEQIDDAEPITAYQDAPPAGQSWSWC